MILIKKHVKTYTLGEDNIVEVENKLVVNGKVLIDQMGAISNCDLLTALAIKHELEYTFENN